MAIVLMSAVSAAIFSVYTFNSLRTGNVKWGYKNWERHINPKLYWLHIVWFLLVIAMSIKALTDFVSKI